MDTRIARLETAVAQLAVALHQTVAWKPVANGQQALAELVEEHLHNPERRPYAAPERR